MAKKDQLVSADANRALEEFSEEMMLALSAAPADQWAKDLGLHRESDVLKTTFPIALDAAGYKELIGDFKYRSLGHRAAQITTKEFSDGVEEKASIIEAPDFVDWAGAPAKMAIEWDRLLNERIAVMLQLGTFAGPLLDVYTDKDAEVFTTRRMFAADHPVNILDASLGSFTNIMTCTEAELLSGEAFEAIDDHFRSLKGANGKPLGLRIAGGTVVNPTARHTLFSKALRSETLEVVDGFPVAMPNRYADVKQRTADELLSDDYFYAIAGGNAGLKPWATQRGSLEEIVHDKDSHLYKTSRKVAIGYVGSVGTAGLLPHPIVRVQITG